MNEKEKEAIEDSKNLIEELKFTKYEDFVGRLCYKGKPIENILLTLNKRIEKQDKMINEMAGSIYLLDTMSEYGNSTQETIEYFTKKVEEEK